MVNNGQFLVHPEGQPVEHAPLEFAVSFCPQQQQQKQQLQQQQQLHHHLGKPEDKYQFRVNNIEKEKIQTSNNR